MHVPITDPEVLEGYNSDALGFRGQPDGLFRPADEKEIQEILRWAAPYRQPVTPVALRSSTPGSCVAPKGYLLSLERLQAAPEIHPKKKTALVQPGLNLGQLKQQLEAQGLFFPPDPTSENDCTIGGAVATNASGARSLKYGAIRGWIRGLRVVLASGEVLDLRPTAVDKNAAGYYGFQDPIQFFIGSEGTLGVISRIELQCVDLPHDYLSVYAFFPDERTALRAAMEIRRRNLGVRCLEYFDDACLALLREAKGAAIPTGVGGMLFFEEECLRQQPDELLEKWLIQLESLGALVEDTMVGDTRARKAEMKELRHAIPATLNERSARLARKGGGKLSTDWAVHYTRSYDVITQSRLICSQAGLNDIYCYGHIGNGHPHFNLMVPDARARAEAKKALHRMCRLVQTEGGTISAEHGVGKVKKEFLRYSFPPQVIDWMRAFKKAVDPLQILAPGNIFNC